MAKKNTLEGPYHPERAAEKLIGRFEVGKTLDQAPANEDYGCDQEVGADTPDWNQHIKCLQWWKQYTTGHW